MPRHAAYNTTGPVVRKLRSQAGWTQEQLAAKLQLKGWDCTRSWLAKIEAQQVYVRDYELLYFRAVFGTRLEDLFTTLAPKAASQGRKKKARSAK